MASQRARPQTRRASPPLDVRLRRNWIVSKATSYLARFPVSTVPIYVPEAFDLDVLRDILSDLEASRLPQPFDLTPSPTRENLTLAISAMKDLASILQALDPALHNPSYDQGKKGLIADHLAVLLESWDDIIKWMLFFIRWTSQSSPDSTQWFLVMTFCVQVLHSAVRASDENESMAQVIALQSTADIYLRFVCLADPDTGRPVMIRARVNVGVSPCTVAGLYDVFSQGRLAQEAILLRLQSISHQQRNRFALSVIRRIQDVATKPLDRSPLLSASEDVEKLVAASILLHRTTFGRYFERHKFALEATRATRTLVEEGVRHELRERAFWKRITHCLRYLIGLNLVRGCYRTVYQVIEGGLIHCFLNTVPRLEDTSLLQELLKDAQVIVSSLTDYEAIRSAVKAGAIHPSSSHYTGGSSPSPVFNSIHGAYYAAFKRGVPLLKVESRLVTVCCSTKHDPSKAGVNRAEAPKICGRCRLFSYCSESCQREDWLAFHSKECSQICQALRPMDLDEAAIRVKTIHEKLSYLEGVANGCLAPLPALRAHQRRYMHSSQPCVAAFDFNVASPDGFLSDVGPREVPLFYYLEMMETTGAGRCAQDRIRTLASDPEVVTGSLAIVEGFFNVGSATLLSVFTKMRYSASAPAGKRYKIVNSSFQVITPKNNINLRPAPPIYNSELAAQRNMPRAV